MPYSFTSEEAHNNRLLLFAPCRTKEEVKAFVHYFLDLELPDTCVDPESNSNMLDMVYTCYSHLIHGPVNEETSRYLFFSSRFGGKTLCESVIEVLLLLHGRLDITHLAALKRQSQDCQKYIAKFFNLPHLKGILVGDSKTEKAAVFFIPDDGGPNLTEKEWKTLPEVERQDYVKVSNTVEVIVASLAATNGKHTALLCLDEIDVMANKEAFEEAKNIPTPTSREDGSLAMPLTLLTSTRKFAFGLVSAEIANAEKTGLIVKHWNILDVCKACPASRHLPDLPKRDIFISEQLLAQATPEVFQTLPIKEKEKYTKISCFEGCVSNCKILPACKTYLATRQTSTSKFLKPITYVQSQIQINNLDKALAQLLCRKPSTEGLVYPMFSKARHVLTPAQAFAKISGETVFNPNMSKEELVRWLRTLGGEWYCGIDWGFTHLYALVLGLKLGNRMFVPYVFGSPGLDPGQKIDHSEQFKVYEPKTFGDTEDPAMIKAFKNAGWRMAQWKKGKIVEGTSTVKLKLAPTLGGEPELYFIRDIGEDAMMDLFTLHLQEYHYKLGPDGKPTEVPDDECKDFPDALRYMIQNVFNFKSGVTLSNEVEYKPKLLSHDGKPVYNAHTWMTQRISELTGNEIRPPQNTRPQMTIEEIGHSYYGKANEEEKKDRKGKSRGVIWDFGE
jgi:hypothetical protein